MKCTLRIAAAAAAVCYALWTTCFIGVVDGADLSKPRQSGRSALLVEVELASDTSGDQIEARDKAIDVLYDQTARAEAERQLARDLFRAFPDDEFKTLVAPNGSRPADYLRAGRQSYARFRGAERAGQFEWTSKHLTATRRYAALAAEGLVAQAKNDEEHMARMRSQSFAVRRPSEQAAVVLATLKRGGLSAEHRRLLRESGLAEEEIDAYQSELLKMSPDNVGTSIVELYAKIGRVRRALATSLETFSGARLTKSGPLSQTYLVGNPHDREETVDLFIRRASVPPEWKFSILDAEPASVGQPQTRVQEVEVGRHYRVRLPAQGRLTVTSVVVPVGVVGENTTVRWATEGKIGDKLIGGIVNEMHVPGFLPDLKLPPIMPAAVTPTPVAPAAAAPPRWRIWLAIAAAALLSIAIVVVLLVRSRRKGAPGP